jgi:excisionase family DNA binding protein
VRLGVHNTPKLARRWAGGSGKKVQCPATLEIFKKLMESVQQNSGWLTATEAAEYLKVRTHSLLLWVRQGKLQAYALSGTNRKYFRIWRRVGFESAVKRSFNKMQNDRRQF